jgi:hypothetical protein
VDERQKVKRRTKYYNKRPAGEERRGGKEGKRQPFVSGRFEGGRLVDWAEQSTVEAGERSDGKAGGYLQCLDVWRQRKPACTTAGPRLIGRVRDEQVKWRAGGGGEVTGPEIDARENSITIYNEANPDRITAAQRALDMWNLTRYLLSVSAPCRTARLLSDKKQSRSYVCSLAPRCVEGSPRGQETKETGHTSLLVPSGAALRPV